MSASTVRFGKYVSVLYRFGSVFMNKKLGPQGLLPGWHGCLMVINDNPGITQEGLCGELLTDKANISRIIKKLRNSKLIKTETDKKDKRIQRLHLTDKGRKTIPVIRKSLADWSRAVSKGITGKEFNAIVRILEIMAANAENEVR
ncbi:MAG: MarR family winged helix-turn-helix transcriptional regulator [Candidatus Goldiibacteriota bacterium]